MEQQLSTSRMPFYCPYNSWVIIMKLATVCCILLCIRSAAHAQTCNPPGCFINGTVETQCRVCPPGYGVAVENRDLQFCSSSPPRDTKCEPCVAGVNFSDTNSRSKCLECRRCHPDKENQTKACTVQSDGECICKEGQFYYDDGTESCVACTMCREDQEETKPCTPTENRECGNKSTTTTTLPPSTVQPATDKITESASSSITGEMSTKENGTGSSSSWWIVIIVLSLIVIIFIVAVYMYIRKNREANGTRQNSGDGNFVLNCCIGNQTNRFNAVSTSDQMNGHAQQYREVPSPTGSEPNGMSNGQSHATTPSISITLEMERQQSPANILGFSQETHERLIRDLDAPDPMGRNALMLANENLEMSQDRQSRLANSDKRALEVLKMWVEQGKTREHLIQALRRSPMNRDDIADYCEEDSAGS